MATLAWQNYLAFYQTTLHLPYNKLMYLFKSSKSLGENKMDTGAPRLRSTPASPVTRAAAPPPAAGPLSPKRPAAAPKLQQIVAPPTPTERTNTAAPETGRVSAERKWQAATDMLLSAARATEGAPGWLERAWARMAEWGARFKAMSVTACASSSSWSSADAKEAVAAAAKGASAGCRRALDSVTSTQLYALLAVVNVVTTLVMGVYRWVQPVAPPPSLMAGMIATVKGAACQYAEQWLGVTMGINGSGDVTLNITAAGLVTLSRLGLVGALAYVQPVMWAALQKVWKKCTPKLQSLSGRSASSSSASSSSASSSSASSNSSYKNNNDPGKGQGWGGARVVGKPGVAKPPVVPAGAPIAPVVISAPAFSLSSMQ
jgi:hypothetical protein